MFSRFRLSYVIIRYDFASAAKLLLMLVLGSFKITARKSRIFDSPFIS